MMERISITIDSKLLERVNAHIKTFATPSQDSRSAYICDLLRRHTPIDE